MTTSASERPLAAIYTRISLDQTREGEGVGRQEELCRDLADRLGYEVVRVYSDNDIGASDRTDRKKVRAQYAEMLHDAAAGRFVAILSYSNSRLTRRVRELEALIELVKATGIAIRTVASGHYDLGTAQGVQIARILLSVDAGESDLISERQQAAFRYRAQAGKPKLQRQRPFGWLADGVTIQPEEAALIREGLAAILAGSTLTAVAHDWESRGIKTAAGKELWEHATLKRVLTGWRTAGVRTYQRKELRDLGGELVMGTWTPIISLEERERALAMLEKHARKKVRQGSWLLSGLVRCGLCGGRMYGRLTATPTYGCKPGRGHVAVTAKLLEDHVMRMLALRLSQRSGSRAEPAEREPWAGEAEVERLVKLRGEYWGDSVAGRISRADAYALVDEIDGQLSVLKAERKAFLDSQVVEELPYRSMRQLLELVQDLLGPEHHTSPKVANHERLAGSNRPWGEAAKERAGEDPDDFEGNGSFDSGELREEIGSLEPRRQPRSGFDAEEQERKLLLASELKYVSVQPGQRGRAGWGEEAFLRRIELIWKDDPSISE